MKNTDILACIICDRNSQAFTEYLVQCSNPHCPSTLHPSVWVCVNHQLSCYELTGKAQHVAWFIEIKSGTQVQRCLRIMYHKVPSLRTLICTLYKQVKETECVLHNKGVGYPYVLTKILNSYMKALSAVHVGQHELQHASCKFRIRPCSRH